MAFAQLERTFCNHLGPVALDRLTALVQRPVPARTIIALGGDQLTGKSTLAKALSHHFGAHTVSSGAVFRSLAKQRGVSLVELLKQAATEVKIDIQCDYGLCELVGGAPLTDIKTDGSVLVLEGRNPACMASYMRAKYGSNIRSVHIHLRCTPLEQSLRFVERECQPATLGQFARHNAQTLMARGAMPSWALGDLDASSVDEAGTRLRALLESLLAGQHEDSWRKAVQPFVENVQRDVLDRQRFATLYGLDYRHKQHYDIRIDTSPNTAADTRRQALDALRPFQQALGLSVRNRTYVKHRKRDPRRDRTASTDHRRPRSKY